MKGTTNPDIGFGLGGNPVSEPPLTFLTRFNNNTSPTGLPEGCSLQSGFEPGFKAGVPRRERKWLTRLRRTDNDEISSSRIDAVAAQLENDDEIDDILNFLDARAALVKQADIFIGT